MAFFASTGQRRFPTLEEIYRGGWQFDPNMYETPVGSGMDQFSLPSHQVPDEMAAGIPAPQKKGGFFRKGGTARNIVGSIVGSVGDALTGNSNFADNMARQQAVDRQEKLYQRRRSDELEDYGKKQEIDARYRQPHYWESNDGSLMALDANGRPQKVYSDPTPKISWVQVQTQRGIELVPVGPSGPMMGNMGGAPGGNLDNTPTIEDGYQYTPGPGGRANQNNWKPIGGASPSYGSPTFP